jgi:hypothetical protein
MRYMPSLKAFERLPWISGAVRGPTGLFLGLLTRYRIIVIIVFEKRRLDVLHFTDFPADEVSIAWLSCDCQPPIEYYNC